MRLSRSDCSADRSAYSNALCSSYTQSYRCTYSAPDRSPDRCSDSGTIRRAYGCSDRGSDSSSQFLALLLTDIRTNGGTYGDAHFCTDSCADHRTYRCTHRHADGRPHGSPL